MTCGPAWRARLERAGWYRSCLSRGCRRRCRPGDQTERWRYQCTSENERDTAATRHDTDKAHSRHADTSIVTREMRIGRLSRLGTSSCRSVRESKKNSFGSHARRKIKRQRDDSRPMGGGGCGGIGPVWSTSDGRDIKDASPRTCWRERAAVHGLTPAPNERQSRGLLGQIRTARALGLGNVAAVLLHQLAKAASERPKFSCAPHQRGRPPDSGRGHLCAQMWDAGCER